MENEKGIIPNSLDEVFRSSMISYAEDVILDRALPRVEDGLKPVQRRILYAMYEMGLTPDKPHRKCAKIVGDVLGRFHPHGDSSVYGALVHLAQDFNMRNPLIDGHGNFGSIDGDGAAAYRYTEARLQTIAYELLRDIDKDTVDFGLNFDDTQMEPRCLPGRFPNLLVNGAMGIAVGLATNIPPHNLAEVINGTVAYIDNPKISLTNIMKYIPAPDFPTGGYIIAGEELVEAYKTGRGKIKMRARVSIEKDTGEKKNIVITEIPFQVNKAELLKKIAELKEGKDNLLSGINDVVDESDRNGMRAVIKLKKDADADKILKYLYKSTALETSFGINMVAIADGKPCQMGLLDIISYYVNYQRDVVLRRSKFDLERAKERAHILEGLIIAVKNIDEVIKIIKGADNTQDARTKLRDRFSLSEVQANAILDLRLARLTKLEVTKLEEELKELKQKIKELTEIVSSKSLQMQIVKKELLEIKKKYKEDRRSIIINGGEIESGKDLEKELMPIEDYYAVYTHGKAFKKVTEKNFNSTDRKIKDNSTGNENVAIFTKIKTGQILLAFTNLGNCCKINIDAISECRLKEKGSKFTEVASDVARNEYPVAFFAINPGEEDKRTLLFITKEGFIRRTAISEFNLQKPFYQAMILKDKDELIAVEYDEPDTTIAFITKKGQILNAVKSGISLVKRASGGVIGIVLNKGDEIVFASQVDDEGEFVIVTDGGCYKRVVVPDIKPQARKRKGVKICELGKVNNVVFASHVKNAYDIVVIDNFGVAFTVNTDVLSIEDRTTKGKTLKNENKKRLPEKVFRLL